MGLGLMVALTHGVVLTGSTGGNYVPFHFTDQTNAAVAFFNNMRTPAALIAGAALSNAFALQALKEDQYNTKMWKRLRTLYVVLMTTTFALELLSILLATSASNRALGGGFNPMAESCIAMISREFPDKLVAVQFNFFTGMLSFIVAQSIRFYRELSSRPFTHHISRAAAWILGFVSFQMLAFFNSQLTHFEGGYAALARTYISDLCKTAFAGIIELKPAPMLAFGCLCAAIFYVMLALLDADQDGKFTLSDLKVLMAEIKHWATGQGELIAARKDTDVKTE